MSLENVMAKSGGGTAATLDRKEGKSATSTGPQLELVVRTTGTASGIQDSSITVIENPLLSGRTGLLLSRHFSQEYGLTVLNDVLHIRADNLQITADNPMKYGSVEIVKGFDRWYYGAYAVVITKAGLALPNASRTPYEVVFINASQYELFRKGLEAGDAAEHSIKSMYQLLAEKAPRTFSLNSAGNLVLPKDYASLRPPTGGIWR